MSIFVRLLWTWMTFNYDVVQIVHKTWIDGFNDNWMNIKYINSQQTHVHLLWIIFPNRTCDWVNPATHHMVVVSSSDGRILPYGNLDNVLSREDQPCNCHTKDDQNGWFALDTGVWFHPNWYTLRHARGYGKLVDEYVRVW